MVGAIIDGGLSMVRPYSNGTIYHSNSVLPIMAITNPVGSLHEATAGASLLVCNYGGGWGADYGVGAHLAFYGEAVGDGVWCYQFVEKWLHGGAGAR